MYWISISTISALFYFYCKGKKNKAMPWESPAVRDDPPGAETSADAEEVVDEPADLSDISTPAESEEESALKDSENGAEISVLEKIKEAADVVEETEISPQEKETSPEDDVSDHAVAEDEKFNMTENGDGEKALREGIDENTDRLQQERNGGKEDSQESNHKQDVSDEFWEKSEHIMAMESLSDKVDPWEWHSVYMRGIEDAYKKRSTDPRMIDIVVIYGERYIEHFPRVKSTIFEHLGDSPRVVSVFKHLAIVLDEIQAYDDAIKVCNTAIDHGLEDGTRTGFIGRIKRISHKKQF
ncbi:hypothetical protein [Desulfocicer niacini]